MVYTCDNWVVIKFKGKDLHYRVLTGTSGGYLSGSSWRLNSRVVRSEFDGDYYYFYGSSGSCYKCYVDSYCLRMNNAHVWDICQEIHGDKVELMLEDTNWLTIDWIIKE